MIQNYSDHAASERTFLAWVRTAIAVMAFGFVVERFDLFLRLSPYSASRHVHGLLSSTLGEITGIGLMVAGLAIVIVAAARFIHTRKQIDDAEPRIGEGSRVDVALALMLFLLGCALMAYLVANLIAHG
jgi:putative membrane protein